ncbi:hypothetical protein D3C79_895910 [compost metagenome]
MPGLTRLRLHQHTPRVIAQDVAATAGHVQHQRVDITGQQHVAAAADHHHRKPSLARLRQGLAHLIVGMYLGEVAGFNIDAEGVVRLERNLLLPVRRHNRPLISTTSSRQAASIRSSTCSKPSTPP